MRIKIEIISGLTRGRSFLLTPGRSMLVGRTSPSGFIIRDDATLANTHFAVECTPREVRVRDLKTPQGTMLNGRRISSSTQLHDGDRIRAGSTEFLIRIEADVENPPAKNLAPENVVTAPLSTGDVENTPLSDADTETKETGVSEPQDEDDDGEETSVRPKDGISRHLIKAPARKVVELLQQLSDTWPMHLCANMADQEHLWPQDISISTYLFCASEQTVIAMHSPRVLSLAETSSFYKLVLSVWEDLPVFIALSRENRSAILAHWRGLMGRVDFSSAEQWMPFGLSCCQRKLMAEVLRLASDDFLDELFSHIEGLILPDVVTDTTVVYVRTGSDLEARIQLWCTVANRTD